MLLVCLWSSIGDTSRKSYIMVDEQTKRAVESMALVYGQIHEN